MALFSTGILLSLLLTACASFKSAPLGSQLKKGNCNQQVVYRYTAEDLPRPLHELNLDTALTSRFSFSALNAAQAIGVLQPLRQYLQAWEEYRSAPTVEKSAEVLALTQRINQLITVAYLEIAAAAGEMDCEEERADQIAAYLKGKEEEVEMKLTVGAIVVGALGAVVTGILLTNDEPGNASEALGIGTGLVEATLGALILAGNRKVAFYHHRNALSDIWTGPKTSTIFPPSVWYYLTYEKPDSGERSLRQQLVDQWLAFSRLAEVKEKDKEKVYGLFFGEGGHYTAEQLAERANMYDQVEAQINLMKQDLKQLALEFERLSRR